MRRAAVDAGQGQQGEQETRRGPLVLGLDLGLANCGWALWRLARNGETFIVDLGVWTTEKSDKKRQVLASHDELRRARELAKSFASLLDQDPVRAVVVEAKSLPRNASAASKIGMAWGVFAGEVERRGLPVVQASPQEVRTALGLSKGASKADVQREVMARSTTIAVKLHGIKPTLWEHPVDASAAVLVCVDSEILRAVRGVGR